MGLGASGDDGRPSPADTDGGTGDTNPSPLEFVIDDELGDGIGIASPWTGPVWGNESTGGQRGPIGVWMGVQPDAYLEASRIVVGRKSEVHGCLPVGEWCSGDPRDQSLEKGGVGLESELIYDNFVLFAQARCLLPLHLDLLRHVCFVEFEVGR